MWPVIPDSGIGASQADAVFASELQRGDEPSAGQVRQAVHSAIRAFGYSGCAERMAQELGARQQPPAVPEAALLAATAGSRCRPCGEAKRRTGLLKWFL